MAIYFWLPNLIALLAFCGASNNNNNVHAYDDLLDRVESIENNAGNEPEVQDFLQSVLQHHDEFRWIQGFVAKATQDYLLPLHGVPPKSKRSFHSDPNGHNSRYGYHYRYQRPTNDVFPYEDGDEGDEEERRGEKRRDEERREPSFNFADEEDDEEELPPHVRLARSIDTDLTDNAKLFPNQAPWLHEKVSSFRSVSEPHSGNNFGLQNIKERIQITPRGANGLVNAPGFKYGWLDEDTRSKREAPAPKNVSEPLTEMPPIADSSLGEFYYSAPHDILGYNGEGIKEEQNASKMIFPCDKMKYAAKREVVERMPPIQLKILDHNRLIKEISKGSKNNSIVLTLKNPDAGASNLITTPREVHALDKVEAKKRSDLVGPSLNLLAVPPSTNKVNEVNVLQSAHDVLSKRAQKKVTAKLNGLGATFDDVNKPSGDDIDLEGSYEYRPFPITKSAAARQTGELASVVNTDTNKAQNKLEDMTEPTSAAEQRELGMVDNNATPSMQMGATEKVLIIPFKKDAEDLDEQYLPSGMFRVKPSNDMIHRDIMNSIKYKKSNQGGAGNEPEGSMKVTDDVLNKLKMDLEKAISADYTLGRGSASDDDYEEHLDDESSDKSQEDKDLMDENHTGEGNEPIDMHKLKRDDLQPPTIHGYFGRTLKSLEDLIVNLRGDDLIMSEQDPEAPELHKTIQLSATELNHRRKRSKASIEDRKRKIDLLQNVAKLLKKRAESNITKEENSKYTSGNELDIIEKTQAILLHITNPPLEDEPRLAKNAPVNIESRADHQSKNDIINQILEMVNLLKQDQHLNQVHPKRFKDMNAETVKLNTEPKTKQIKHREHEYLDKPHAVHEGYADVETLSKNHKKADLGYKRFARDETPLLMNSVNDFSDVIESSDQRKRRLRRQLDDDSFDDNEIDSLLSPIYAIQGRNRKVKKSNDKPETTPRDLTREPTELISTQSALLEGECAPPAKKLNYQKMCKSYAEQLKFNNRFGGKEAKKIDSDMSYDNREDPERCKKLRDKEKQQRWESKYEKTQKRVKEKEHLKDILNGNLVLNLMERFSDKLKDNHDAFARFGNSMGRKCAEEQVEFLRVFREDQAKKEVRHAQLMLHQIIVMMNKIVTDQVRRKLCVPLAPSVHQFLTRLTAVHLPVAKPMGVAEGYPLPPIKGENMQKNPYVPSMDEEQGDFLFNDPANPMWNKNNKNEIKKKMRLIKKLLQKYEKMAENCQVKVEPVRDYLLEHLALMHKLCLEKYNNVESESDNRICSVRPELPAHPEASTGNGNGNGNGNGKQCSTPCKNSSMNGFTTTGLRKGISVLDRTTEPTYNISVSLESATHTTQLLLVKPIDNGFQGRPMMLLTDNPLVSPGLVSRNANAKNYFKKQHGFYYPDNDNEQNMSNKYKKLVEAAATYRRKRQIEERLARLFGKRDARPEEAQKRQVEDVKEVQDLSRVPYETPIVYSMDGR